MMSNDKMREEFEARVKAEQGLDLTRLPHGGYRSFATHQAWWAWQASCAAHAAQGEPVGWVNSDELDNMLDDRTATLFPVRTGFHGKPVYAAPPSSSDVTQLVGDAEYDTMLFCDLKTDEEKSTFFLSGRGYETGVIAQAIQNDVAMAYHRCSEYRKELEALRDEFEKLQAEYEQLISYTKNGIECFANPCPEHSGINTPPFSEFQKRYGRLCLMCVVDEREALQDESEKLSKDAERYWWLRRGGSDDIGVVRGFDGIDCGSTSVAYTYEEVLYGARLDAAIDAAIKEENPAG